MKKNVFVVIVTYNGDRWIEVNIKSLLKSHYPCKIVVIDNGSTDSTIDIISKFKAIKLIDNHSTFWTEIPGTRGAIGKKTVNNQTYFGELFE